MKFNFKPITKSLLLHSILFLSLGLVLSQNAQNSGIYKTPRVRVSNLMIEVHANRNEVRSHPTAPRSHLGFKTEPQRLMKEMTAREAVVHDTVNNTEPVLADVTLSSNEEESEESKYYTLIRHALEEKKFYPESAKSLQQEGTVVIQFLILEDGIIVQPRILKASSFTSLNEASLLLLKMIRKFPPLPESLKSKPYLLEIPIKYFL